MVRCSEPAVVRRDGAPPHIPKFRRLSEGANWSYEWTPDGHLRHAVFVALKKSL